MTVDGDCLVLANSSFDRANAYVAGSRHKQNCYWFVDSQETDSELYECEKELNESNRLLVLANWLEKDTKPKLAIELLSGVQKLTRVATHSL